MYKASFAPSLQRSILVSQIDQFLSGVACDPPSTSKGIKQRTDVSLERARAERALQKSIILAKTSVHESQLPVSSHTVPTTVEKINNPRDVELKKDFSEVEVCLIDAPIPAKIE